MDKQTLDDLGDLTLGDLARKSVEIELSGIKMPSGFTRFIKAIERIVLAPSAIVHVGQYTLGCWNKVKLAKRHLAGGC